ncbi:acyltransferase [Gordonia sp. CPCC 205515]|uniref:acyltransferase n=1 Tax=Gordonia sp. CPCC 205515 TaxID=3140791 RepID=UPI003AF3FD3C
MVANIALNFVFFFEHHLDADALAQSFTEALDQFPPFAGRMGLTHGRMRIRCNGRGVPFTAMSSEHTLSTAIRATTTDTGLWLVDPVDGATARWGVGPVCRVRVTHFADDATAIGISWHHAIGDMATLMLFLNAWAAAAAGDPITPPLIVEDRAAYLDEQLPADGTDEPGIRFLTVGETMRSAAYLMRGAHRQRTLGLYFGADEITRMRNAYGAETRLSANDVVCAHICASLMNVDPTVDHRTLAIAVNLRERGGLDPALVGNIITTLQVPVFRGEDAGSIAERLRHRVNRLADEGHDIRTNQRMLDAAGRLTAPRCVSTSFDPVRWNPLITNLSGFGVYRIRFGGADTYYCTQVLTLPVAGLGALLDGTGGRGLVFQMSLPPREFDVMSKSAMRERIHQFRRPSDDIPQLHRDIHG